MRKILGVDLGTTYSVSAIIEGGVVRVLKQKNGSKLLPSVFAFNKQTNEILIGRSVDNVAFDDNWVVVRSVKSSMGEKHIRNKLTGELIKIPKPSGGNYSPADISALYLKELKSNAEDLIGEKIDNVVITVPAYFNDKERKATINAGKIAGFDVEMIINEPTAAALEYSYGKNKENLHGNILVYDFGGGTFDVSIINVSQKQDYKVLSTGGNAKLGGDDIDKKLFEYLKSCIYQDNPHHVEWFDFDRRVYEAARKAKEDLSFSDYVMINLPSIGMATNGPINVSKKLTVEELNEVMYSIINETIETTTNVLNESGLTSEQLDEVILVGGSTRIPLVKEKIQLALQRSVNLTVDPDESIAGGASIKGGNLSGEIDDISLLDVTSHDIGIELGNDVFGVIIPKNTTIPTNRSKTFTNENNANLIEVPIIQGDSSLRASKANEIGVMKLRLEDKFESASLEVGVEFDINVDGIINIIIKDNVSGEKIKGYIDSTSTMSELEIKDEFAQMDKLYKSMN